MSGSLAYAFGLVSSAVGAAVAGVPWVAVAALLAAIPYVVIGLVRTRQLLRTRHRRTRHRRVRLLLR